MSRISRGPVSIASGVTCSVNGMDFSAKGQKGMLSLRIPKGMVVSVETEGVFVRPVVDTDQMRQEKSAISGTLWRLIRNMIHGVSEGFEVAIELIGVGYRAEVQGSMLKLSLGFSDDKFYPIAQDIKITAEKPTLLKISGIDKQRVGQVAAELRRMRPPEPYKGKGVHRVGDYVHRKEGKSK